jgi:alkylation response protein AidB-like acyl-CoA dehydrogenase
MSAQTTHSVTPADPRLLAQSLRPLLLEHAATCEREGQIAPAVLAALEAAGLFRMMFPRRAGGVGRTLMTFIETVAELGKACPGTAWAFGLLSSVTASTASLPPAITREVFVTGNERVCSVTARTGTATPTASGWRVSGSWPYASGCMHAQWALNGVNILDADGKVIEAGLALLPLQGNSAVRIQPTWQVAGVCGSGSHTVVAEDVELPGVLVLAFSKLRSAKSTDPAVLALLEPRDHWPVEPLFPLTVLAPMLGAAQGLQELVRDTMAKRKVIGWNYASQADVDIFVQQFGEASMALDSAWLHIRRAAGLVDDVAPTRALSGFEKAQMQADCGYAMQLVRGATMTLMDIAGPSGFATSNPMQRLWRDVGVGSRHNALNSRLSLDLYGRALLGHPSNLEMLPDISRTQA